MATEIEFKRMRLTNMKLAKLYCIDRLSMIWRRTQFRGQHY